MVDKMNINNELSPQQLLQEVYGKELNTKKNILEYIDKVRELSKNDLEEKNTKDTYIFIEKSIQDMSVSVKPNTIVFLKNELKSKLGKYSGAAVGRENSFLTFFKQTYEDAKKTREYTFVMADITKIREQQIIDTLKTINAYCFKNKLTQSEKKDTMVMIERLVDGQNIRYINQLRSMEGLRKAFKIKVIEEDNRYKILRLKK